MNGRLTLIHALSPLHAGVGQGAGVIDLPIAREKATGIPYLPGSSLKGALRTRCQMNNPEYCGAIFGPSRPDEDNNSASMIQFSDQRLLLLPVRSLAGTFAWVTSPYLLYRFQRDIQDTRTAIPDIAIPTVNDQRHCLIAENVSVLTLPGLPQQANSIYLEDLDLQSQPHSSVVAWAQSLGELLFPGDPTSQELLIGRLCIVHDDTLNFLLQTATEIITRIRLKEDTKTVEDGGLWYEEALPTESVLSGIALVTPRANGSDGAAKVKPKEVFPIIEGLIARTLQLGGKATVGRGMCRVRFSGENNNANA